MKRKPNNKGISAWDVDKNNRDSSKEGYYRNWVVSSNTRDLNGHTRVAHDIIHGGGNSLSGKGGAQLPCLNIQDYNGRTELMLAVILDKLPFVKLLLDLKVYVDMEDKFGKTALDYAEENKGMFREQILELLTTHIEALSQKEK